jgi:hypothetical protein
MVKGTEGRTDEPIELDKETSCKLARDQVDGGVEKSCLPCGGCPEGNA